ncbi:MAG: hypothetical protein ACRDNG_03825, partial [Gaiellaceae bacterium]
MGALDDRALLEELAAISDVDERARRLFAEPRLLVPGVLERVADDLGGDDPATTPPELLEVLNLAYTLGAAVEADSQAYPLGLGPVERLWERVASGEIGSAYAAEVARGERLGRLLSPAYADRLCGLTLEAARDEPWQSALELHGLLVAAAEPDDADIAPEVRDRVAFDWILVALLALMRAPDDDLLQSARAAGDGLVARAGAAGDADAVAEALYRLGILHLDPYAARPALGPELRTAEAYLREAVASSVGRQYGVALEALAVALSALETHDEPVDRGEIVRLARESLPLLAGPDDVPYRLAAQAVLHDHGEA